MGEGGIGGAIGPLKRVAEIYIGERREQVSNDIVTWRAFGGFFFDPWTLSLVLSAGYHVISVDRELALSATLAFARKAGTHLSVVNV
jgi:hypothetical protein